MLNVDSVNTKRELSYNKVSCAIGHELLLEFIRITYDLHSAL